MADQAEGLAAESFSAESLASDIRATLMPGFVGTEAPEWVFEALADGLQSVCVYGGNIESPEQLAALGRSLRDAAPHALISIDEEGGEVTRLHYREGAPYPGATILGRIDDIDLTERIGRAVARDVLAAGFNFALAPDADVNSNPENPVIGTRSFGADPQRAARHVAAWVRGLQAEGALAAPKHFPGHGDTAQDSHHALPTVDATLEEIRRRDLPPFASAVDAGAASIMTSHILVPALDPESPATMSRPVLEGLLREELGFRGAIVTDALDMAGASGEIGIPEAAVRALIAGCDLLCLGTDATAESFAEIEAHIATAVTDGRLSPERLREAADRVRVLASAGRRIGAETRPAIPVGTADIARITASFEGAEDAAVWLREHPDAAVVRVESAANMAIGFAPWGPWAAAEHPLPGTEGAAAAFAERTVVTIDAETAMPWAIAAAVPVIVVGRDLHRHAFARAGIDALRDAGHPVLVVDMGWPGPKTYADVACYGASRLAGAALLELLAGKD